MFYFREIWFVNNDNNEETIRRSGLLVNEAQLRDNERTSVKWPHLQKMSHFNEVTYEKKLESMKEWEHLKGKQKCSFDLDLFLWCK